MSSTLHPALQIRIDEARRYSEIPPTTAPHGISYVRVPRLHLPHFSLRRHPH